MNTSSFRSASQIPACPMTMPSSIAEQAGVVDEIVVGADGGRTRTNASSPFVGDVTI